MLVRFLIADALLDEPDYVSGFRAGAGALIIIGAEIERFIKRVKKLDQEPVTLDELFDQDKSIFQKQLTLLYGAK